MADKFLTLLDMSKRDGDGSGAIPLIEEINTVAPELESLKGVPTNGITYTIRKRVALPASPVFRNANEGTDIVSSTYDKGIGQCFFLDAQLKTDEMVVSAGKAEGNSMSEVLADEAFGVMRTKAIHIGDQFYRGLTADSKGFIGLQSLYDSTNCEVSATGSSGAATSAWLVWNDPQGVHWKFGANKGLELGEWVRQQTTDPNGKSYHAYCNNLSGWLGLYFGHTKSIVRVKLITTASGKTFTDMLAADAIAKLPIFMRRSPNLLWFMNSVCELGLRKSRSTVSTAKTDSLILQFAPPATETNGVRIVLTDSIPNNE
jgi:major capsid protein gp7